MAVTFQPVLTQAGLNAAARAQAEGRVLQITHVALGTGAYTPDGEETALAAEKDRAPVTRRTHAGGSTWQIAAKVVGTSLYWAKEVGFIADDNGTEVLMFVHSHPSEVFAAMKDGIETLLELGVSLGPLPPGVVEFDFLDADIPVQELLDDAEMKHLPGSNFNTPLVQMVRDLAYSNMEAAETAAQAMRSIGQSGIIYGRGYGYGGDASYHRPGVVTFAAQGGHDHPNYPLMCGMPEQQVCINGHVINTRHCDYRIMESIGGAYLEVRDAGLPTVPPSVLAKGSAGEQIAEMREYFRAFAAADPSIRDYRDHFTVNLAVLEMWDEVMSDELVDSFPSFRHQLSRLGHHAMNDDMAELFATGLKPRYENSDFKPSIIRSVGDDGKPEFAIRRYRISCVKLGTYRNWPVHQMVSLLEDAATQERFGVEEDEMLAGRLARFRVNYGIGDAEIKSRYGPGLLDTIMGKVPGLDGLGATINSSYTDTHENGTEFVQRLKQWKSETDLNEAYYQRHYSYLFAGAAGRRDYRFGYNDPTLFRAVTTRPEVAAGRGMGGNHRTTWAIPLEIVIGSPLATWNPYGVEEKTAYPSGNGTTSGTAFSHAHKNGRWYRTPASLFDGPGAVVDPADTNVAAYMKCADGQNRLLRGSGVYIHLPAMAGVGDVRLRYPIAPGFWDGSPVRAEMDAKVNQIRGAYTALGLRVQEMGYELENMQKALAKKGVL